MNRIDRSNYFQTLDEVRLPHHDGYYSMYSSVLGGITDDPLLMQVPIDDHVVHRGDGVFETMKVVGGALYNLGAHLDRFEKSARLLDFEMPWSMDEIEGLIVETVKAGSRPDCSVRLMLSRGPGSFGVNPYDCVGPQIYVTASKLPAGFMELHPEGATLGISRVAAKLSFFARVKNCNYLPNVLMKKESVDMGVDFVAGFDGNGVLTEGATENVGIVTRGGCLVFPTLDAILCGTTMMRVIELARKRIGEIGLQGVEMRDIPLEEMRSAREILIVGTTPDVTAVREFDGDPVGNGAPGMVASALYGLLRRDIEENADLRRMIL